MDFVAAALQLGGGVEEQLVAFHRHQTGDDAGHGHVRWEAPFCRA
ncbi:MAG TPA: hypothetical protein VMW62_18670 [Chloroflexota bacterium]|nr:hypothetical protein [Chloroflexota bacterium]